MDKTTRIHILRRTTQVLFILLIIAAPFFDIFRFDSDTSKLIFFGSEWSLGLTGNFYADHSFKGTSLVALQFFLKAILPWIVILAIFPLLGTILGRFFCGWFCPEGTMFEFFDYITLRTLGRRSIFGKKPNDPEVPSKNRLLYSIIGLLSMIFIPLVIGAVLTGYIVNPKTVWSQIFNWDFTFGVKAGIIGVAIYIFITGMIVRHTFCKYVCGAGLMQMLFGWASPVSLRVTADPLKLSFCTDCKKCEKVCFMNVKPRLPKKDINCVNCGECIVACNKELGLDKSIFKFAQSKDCYVPAKEKTDNTGDALLNYKNNQGAKI